jgi:hypothetical protein
MSCGDSLKRTGSGRRGRVEKREGRIVLFSSGTARKMFDKPSSRGDSPARLIWRLRVRNERTVGKTLWARKVAWKAEGTISPLETWLDSSTESDRTSCVHSISLATVRKLTSCARTFFAAQRMRHSSAGILQVSFRAATNEPVNSPH